MGTKKRGGKRSDTLNQSHAPPVASQQQQQTLIYMKGQKHPIDLVTDSFCKGTCDYQQRPPAVDDTFLSKGQQQLVPGQRPIRQQRLKLRKHLNIQEQLHPTSGTGAADTSLLNKNGQPIALIQSSGTAKQSEQQLDVKKEEHQHTKEGEEEFTSEGNGQKGFFVAQNVKKYTGVIGEQEQPHVNNHNHHTRLRSLRRPRIHMQAMVFFRRKIILLTCICSQSFILPFHRKNLPRNMNVWK